jgi:hypothetical protein
MDQKEKPSKETLDKWHKDPNNWTLGLFYYNKEDKRIFPQKRMAGWMDCQFRKSYFSSRISNCINHYNQD